eukprot:5315279-Pleurochrysis_carterae.AAC.4
MKAHQATDCLQNQALKTIVALGLEHQLSSVPPLRRSAFELFSTCGQTHLRKLMRLPMCLASSSSSVSPTCHIRQHNVSLAALPQSAPSRRRARALQSSWNHHKFMTLNRMALHHHALCAHCDALWPFSLSKSFLAERQFNSAFRVITRAGTHRSGCTTA